MGICPRFCFYVSHEIVLSAAQVQYVPAFGFSKTPDFLRQGEGRKKTIKVQGISKITIVIRFFSIEPETQSLIKRFTIGVTHKIRCPTAVVINHYNILFNYEFLCKYRSVVKSRSLLLLNLHNQNKEAGIPLPCITYKPTLTKCSL